MINTPCIDRQALYNLYADYHAKKMFSFNIEKFTKLFNILA